MMLCLNFVPFVFWSVNNQEKRENHRCINQSLFTKSSKAIFDLFSHLHRRQDGHHSVLHYTLRRLLRLIMPSATEGLEKRRIIPWMQCSDSVSGQVGIGRNFLRHICTSVTIIFMRCMIDDGKFSNTRAVPSSVMICYQFDNDTSGLF